MIRHFIIGLRRATRITSGDDPSLGSRASELERVARSFVSGLSGAASPTDVPWFVVAVVVDSVQGVTGRTGTKYLTQIVEE